MGFKKFTELVQNATELDFSKIMLQKLDLWLGKERIF
jgi:hypothetical protein